MSDIELASIRIGICQINPKVGDLESNANLIVETARKAHSLGSQISVFPELALCGYPPEDLLLKPSFIRATREHLNEIAKSVPESVLLIGHPEEDGRLYNSASFTFGGEVFESYRKRLLPNYAVFDEQRYFVAANSPVKLFEIFGVKVGVSICEDIWSPIGPALDEVRGGAELILNLNASPFSIGRRWQRAMMLSVRSSDLSTPIVYVNLVGGQDELVFDGGSMAFDQSGSLIVSVEAFVEKVEVVSIDLVGRGRKFQLDPRGLMSDLDPEIIKVVDNQPSLEVPSIDPGDQSSSNNNAALWTHPSPRFDLNWVDSLDNYDLGETLSALILGLRDYVNKNGFRSVVMGLSGGIDSSLCAAICTLALGKERTFGIAMPSRYNAGSSLDDAQILADNLGIGMDIVAISSLHQEFRSVLKGLFGSDPKGLTDENLQSRIRGVLLMAYSNATGAMVITTGNKSEIATGYSTLYGDSAGGFALIKDLPKLLVFKLCRYINEVAFGREVIPESVIIKPPSAELRPDQLDQDSLPPYEVLDPVLMALVERDMTTSQMVTSGFDPELVSEISTLIDRSEYKRRQGAPGVRVTPRAFGKDRRMPITNGFDQRRYGL